MVLVLPKDRKIIIFWDSETKEFYAHLPGGERVANSDAKALKNKIANSSNDFFTFKISIDSKGEKAWLRWKFGK